MIILFLYFPFLTSPLSHPLPTDDTLILSFVQDRSELQALQRKPSVFFQTQPLCTPSPSATSKSNHPHPGQFFPSPATSSKNSGPTITPPPTNLFKQADKARKKNSRAKLRIIPALQLKYIFRADRFIRPILHLQHHRPSLQSPHSIPLPHHLIKNLEPTITPNITTTRQTPNSPQHPIERNQPRCKEAQASYLSY